MKRRKSYLRPYCGESSFHVESFPARSMPIHKFLMSLRYCMLRLETERVSVQGKKKNLLLKVINFRFLAVENCERQSFLGLKYSLHDISKCELVKILSTCVKRSECRVKPCLFNLLWSGIEEGCL